MDYDFHEAANIFPLDEENLDALADDIKKHGQEIPIEILDGKILDGRRRYMATRIAGVNPVLRVVTVDDPVQYVMSLNLHRRHLNESQRAMCAARAEDVYAKAAKQRQAATQAKPGEGKVGCGQLATTDNGRARDQVGEAFQVGGRTVSRAKKVIKDGEPELVKAVESGKVSVTKAESVVGLPKEFQLAVVKEANESPVRRRPEKPVENKKDGKKEKPKLDGENNMTELFAMNKARVAITQIEGIPVANAYRDAAFAVVEKWIESQRSKK